MPKKNTTISNRRQAPITKIIKAAQAEQKRDLTNKWRFLRKIGAYQTKETAAAIRLTDSRIRAINKKFKEMQTMKKLVGGKTVRPIISKTRMIKGKPVTDYGLSDFFSFVRTKKKTSVIEGVRKTGKGYIVEKTNKNSSVHINKRGEVEELIGAMRRKRIKFKGKDLIKLLEKFEKGTYKFKRHEIIILHKFGSQTQAIESEQSAVDLLVQYFNELKEQMPEIVFNDFMNSSYIEIIEEKPGSIPNDKN